MTIVMLDPGESGAQKIINIAHKINSEASLKKFLKEILLSLVCGVKDEIINVEAHVDGGSRWRGWRKVRRSHWWSCGGNRRRRRGLRGTWQRSRSWRRVWVNENAGVKAGIV